VTTDEEQRGAKEPAVRAVFPFVVGATVGAVFGGWIGSAIYTPPRGPGAPIVDVSGALETVLFFAVLGFVIGGIAGRKLWRLSGRSLDRRDPS
jgi:hypothetical protein